MQDIVIDVGMLPTIAAGYRLAPNVVREELYAAVLEADALLEREAKDYTPTATGLTRASIFGEERATEYGALGVVGSPVQHAVYVELGTRPHFPPLEPLMDWVAVKFGITDEQEQHRVAFAIARKIAARGTLAVGMFHRAFAHNEAQVESIFLAARDRIAARLPAA